MAWNKIGNIAALSLAFIFAACGGDSKSSSSEVEISLREVSTIYDLGACTKDRNGDTVLVIDKAIEYLCVGSEWLDITTKNTGVPQSSNSEGYSSSGDVLSSGEIVNNSSSSSVADDPLNNNSSSSVKTTYVEISSKEKLVACDSANINMRALVLADSSYYTCKVKGWVKDSVYLGYEIVKSREDLGVCNTGNVKQRVLVKKDSVFFNCDSQKWAPETADGYIVKNASILGAAQKGPFKFDSPLMLREVLLHNDALTYTGREYIDEISSNKGDFVIPKVNLIYPYAVLEVRGQWRNEISGEWSKDSMTLRALTDLTSRTEVNINLLTHLEYDRAVQLVSKGYSVFAAKKQAEYEIMTAFGFATTIEYSENLKTFVASTNEDHESNATLMAIALLFIGDRSEAEIVSAINDFKRDMASDGTWNDEQAKADMADWAESFDGGSIRANVKSWNILTIPDYENYLTIFWNNAYELGGCSSTRSNVIAQNKNTKSKNYNVHYICKATSWQKATDYEKDTYQWADGKEGEFKKGNVTETYYVFENGKWTVAKNESALGLCSETRSGEIGKVDSTYYICKNKSWGKATVLEYDTYQFGTGEDGEVRHGKVNADKFYVYENGAWRASTNENENNLGACVSSREGVVGKSGSTYYICKSKSWVTATALEYDTYGWTAGTEGEVKAGTVNTDSYYIYNEDKWRGASSVEKDLNGCTASREGVVGKSGNTYYICKSKEWGEATALEYDTYGWMEGTEGEVKPGSVNSNNHYIFENGVWRASTSEIENNLGACVTSRDGEKYVLNNAYYICENKKWKQITVEEYGLGYCTAQSEGIVKKHNDVYYICKSSIWQIASALEYDTYGWTSGKEGDVKNGSVNTDKYYVYEKGRWRESTSEVENNYGACISMREGIKLIFNDKYYICHGEKWDNVSEVVYNLGYCTSSKSGVVATYNDVYYTCKSGTWSKSTVLEYDTYGLICPTNGSIVSGSVHSEKKYVCSTGQFRAATEIELSLGKGCVSYTNNSVIRKHILEGLDSVYTCNGSWWAKSAETYPVYGTLLDERDQQSYKTIVIGNQTWMAENLNYSDSVKSPGLKGRIFHRCANCKGEGYYYRWSAAMDSAGTFSPNGKGCSRGKKCSPTYPVRGICPEGWHLPTNAEWANMFEAAGSSSYAMQAMDQTAWPNATNKSGFSAFPIGYYEHGSFIRDGFDDGYAAYWSSSIDAFAYVGFWYLKADDAALSSCWSGNPAHTVRCVKDEN